MNIYYSPEHYGLEIVGEIEFSDGCYQFDTTVVWRDKESGKLYYAADSGCSCPSPFELTGRGDLTPITRTQDLIDHLEQRKQDNYRYDPDDEWAKDAVAEIDGASGALILKAKGLL